MYSYINDIEMAYMELCDDLLYLDTVDELGSFMESGEISKRLESMKDRFKVFIDKITEDIQVFMKRIGYEKLMKKAEDLYKTDTKGFDSKKIKCADVDPNLELTCTKHLFKLASKGKTTPAMVRQVETIVHKEVSNGKYTRKVDWVFPQLLDNVKSEKKSLTEDRKAEAKYFMNLLEDATFANGLFEYGEDKNLLSLIVRLVSTYFRVISQVFIKNINQVKSIVEKAEKGSQKKG